MHFFYDKYSFAPRLFESAWLGWVSLILGVTLMVISMALFIRQILRRRAGETKDEMCNEDKRIGCVSIVGTRKHQQDRVAVAKAVVSDKEELLFAAVCDGMGGMDDGERASEYSIRRIVNFFTSISGIEEFGEGIKRMLRECDSEVAAFTDNSGRVIDSGTTVVAAIAYKERVTWISVGDSAVYLFENNKLKKLNREHNYGLAVEEMVNNGEITQEQADNEPNKEMLISYIGMGDLTLIDGKNMTKVADNAILMLCSDGVTKLVTDDELQVLLQTNKDALPQSIAKEIVDYSVKNRVSSQDNTTVAVIKCNPKEKKYEREE